MFNSFGEKMLPIALLSSLSGVGCKDNKAIEKPPVADGRYKEITFAKSPGILRTLEPQKACPPVGFDQVTLKKENIFNRFAKVINECGGNLQRGKVDGRDTYFRTTIPGYRVNGRLAMLLEGAFDQTGMDRGLEQVQRRTFIMKRNDALDGLIPGNLSDFGQHAITSAIPGVSATFSTINLSGDNVQDIGAFATEICQTRMIAENDDNKAEAVCNSFGNTVKMAMTGYDYERYQDEINRSSGVLPGGRRFRFKAFNPSVFEGLKDGLSAKPDILEIKR